MTYSSDQATNITALFTTCVVDQILPEVGVATVKVLRRAGFEVAYPEDQTCCGQPFFNSGFLPEARRLAKQTIEILEPYSAVVIPSGSCTAMIRKEYGHLFVDQPAWQERANELAKKTFELTEFLTREVEIRWPDRQDSTPVTYHDSCHMCRTLGIKEPPRQLLKQAGYAIHEMEEPDRCCGFGGVFSVRMPEASGAMTAEKIAQAKNTTAGLVVTSDPGCMMQMKGHLDDDPNLKVKHIAEVLEEVTR